MESKLAARSLGAVAATFQAGYFTEVNMTFCNEEYEVTSRNLPRAAFPFGLDYAKYFGRKR